MSKLAKNQLPDLREAAAMLAVQCPLQPCLDPTTLLKSFRSSTRLRILQGIEEHISTGECHHPPLKEVVFHGSLDGTTPLLLACHYGDPDCVKRLVDVWHVDVNAPAVYYDDISNHYFCKNSSHFKSATPLFVAVFSGHVPIVRYLLEKGADVSSKTCSDSNTYYDGLTPLHGAIRSPYRKYKKSPVVTSLVRLLLQSGADPSALPSDGRPIWMESLMYDASTTIELISHGMNLLQKNSAGETVLHRCTDLHYHQERLTANDLLTVVKLLVEKGADLMSRDNQNFTPILTAASSSNWAALDFLLERDEIHRMEKIDALEMVSVKEVRIFKHHPDPNDPEYQRIFDYWRRALRLRGKEDPKIPLTLKSGRAGEWANKKELEYVIQHPSEYHLQMYLAKLRVSSARGLRALSSTYADDRLLRQGIIYTYLNSLQKLYQFAELQDILLATLETISEAISRFSSQDIESALGQLSYRCFDLFIWMLRELERHHRPLFNAGTFETILNALVATSSFRCTVRTADAYMNTLLELVTRLVKLSEILTEGKNDAIKSSLRKLVIQNSRDSRGRTLLHLVLNKELLLNNKNVPTIRLLLRCGANVNAGDWSGDSSLHLLVSKRSCDDEVIDCVGRLFWENGAHLDKVNKNGETAAQLWTRIKKRDLPEWLQDETVPKLSCLSARIIRSHKIAYNKKLPRIVRFFIEMH